METIPTRISVHARDLALQYGKSVSQGIVAMHEQVTLGNSKPAFPVTQGYTSAQNTVTYGVTQTSPAEKWRQSSQVAADGSIRIGDMSEKEYWKRIKMEIDAVVKEYGGKGY